MSLQHSFVENLSSCCYQLIDWRSTIYVCTYLRTYVRYKRIIYYVSIHAIIRALYTQWNLLDEWRSRTMSSTYPTYNYLSLRGSRSVLWMLLLFTSVYEILCYLSLFLFLYLFLFLSKLYERSPYNYQYLDLSLT